jgi:hypothetical protein
VVLERSCGKCKFGILGTLVIDAGGSFHRCTSNIDSTPALLGIWVLIVESDSYPDYDYDDFQNDYFAGRVQVLWRAEAKLLGLFSLFTLFFSGLRTFVTILGKLELQLLGTYVCAVIPRGCSFLVRQS